MLAGQLTFGASLSRTMTVKEQLPILPELSVAVQVTVVIPLGNAVPEAGVQVGVIVPSQLSLAVAV
jgi:hypothetical protein